MRHFHLHSEVQIRIISYIPHITVCEILAMHGMGAQLIIVSFCIQKHLPRLSLFAQTNAFSIILLYNFGKL